MLTKTICVFGLTAAIASAGVHEPAYELPTREKKSVVTPAVENQVEEWISQMDFKQKAKQLPHCSCAIEEFGVPDLGRFRRVEKPAKQWEDPQ